MARLMDRFAPTALFVGLAALFLVAPLGSPTRADAASPPGAVDNVSELMSDADRAWLGAHGPVKIGLPTMEWPPFDMFATDGQYRGLTADYEALLGARLGMRIEYVRFPTFNATLDALRNGDVDAMASIARTPDRESFALFTLPYITSQPVIITRKDDTTIQGLNDLQGKKIAIEVGFASHEYLKNLSGISFVNVIGTKEALQAVSLGQANAYVGSLITTTYIMDRDALSNLEVRTAAGLPISDLRFAVTKNLPELARLFDHGVASISEQEHQAIHKKWIGAAGLGPDWGAISRVAIPIVGALLSIILITLIWNQRLHRQVARRRAAEAALARQMSFQMALLENLPALIAYKDTDARFIGCNRAYEEAFGVNREQLLGKTTLDIEGFPSEQRERGYAQDLEALRTGEPLHREEQLVFIDGATRDILLWRIPFKLPDGTSAGLLSITIDVSRQKAAERALADQLAYQRSLIDTMPSPIWVKDSEARFIGCNRAYEEAFGTTRDALFGKTVRELPFLEPQRREAMYRRDLGLLRTKGRHFSEELFDLADGAPHDMMYWVHTFDLADGSTGGLVGALVDVSETKALERQAQAAERKLREITDNIPGAVYQIRAAADEPLEYTFVSEGIRALRGHSREEVLADFNVCMGQVLDEDRPALVATIGKALSELVPVEGEYRIRMPDESVRWLRSAAVPSQQPDGSVVLNGFSVDVTAHREMEAALDDARAAADAANHAKSAFLATMSHEIRTPMNGVIGMLELLGLSRLSKQQRTQLEVVQESGRALLRVVNDILDFSKIEAGMLDLNPEPTSLAAIVNGVRETYAGAASGKNLVLGASTDPRISPAVMVDPLRLRQILNNFVSNAVKFTTEGSIEIEAELVARRDQTDTVRFTVVDTGIGISAENQKKLFQPFVQAERDTTRRFGGTGLGLAICRRIAEMMGGTITMESELGRGTAMQLLVPLAVADPMAIGKTDDNAPVDAGTLAARRPAPTTADAAAEGTLILVADDHSTNRMMLRGQLDLLGYACETAGDGREAFKLWQSGRFALLITDCHMPEMDGYDLTRAIREREAGNGGHRTPIIACTANAMDGEAEACIAAGMDGYLAKPVELRPLLNTLDCWLPLLEKPRHGSARQRETPKRSGKKPVAPPIDRTKLTELTGGDVAFEREILAEFCSTVDDDAAQLAAAVGGGDCDATARVSHRIKGASRIVGALALSDICEKIEAAGRSADRAAMVAQHAPFARELERLKAVLV